MYVEAIKRWERRPSGSSSYFPSERSRYETILSVLQGVEQTIVDPYSSLSHSPSESFLDETILSVPQGAEQTVVSPYGSLSHSPSESFLDETILSVPQGAEQTVVDPREILFRRKIPDYVLKGNALMLVREWHKDERSWVQPCFITLQRWEGYVVEVKSDSFIARLVDRDRPKAPEEEADILLEEITQDDHEMVQPGAVFYWSIGYRDQVGGQRERVSVIRFRRLPLLMEEDIDRARAEAGRTIDRLDWR